MDREQLERDVLRYLEGERPCEFTSGAQQLQQQIHLVGDADEQSQHPAVLEKELTKASEELMHHQAQSQQPEQQPKQQQQQQDGLDTDLPPPAPKKAKWTKYYLYNPLHDGRAERNPHYMRWLHKTPEQELKQQRLKEELEKRRAVAQEQQRARDDSADSDDGWIPPHRKSEPRPPPRPRKKIGTANRARIAPSPA